MSRDTRNEFLPTKVFFNGFAGDGTANSEIIDTEGTVGSTFVFDAANYTDGTYTFELFDSDDSGLAGATSVIDDKLRGTEAGLTISGAVAQGDDLGSIGAVGTKRFVRWTVTAASVSTGADISIIYNKVTRVTPPEGLSA